MNDFVVDAPHASKPQVVDEESERPKLEPDPEPDVRPGEEVMLCPACLFPNLPEAGWCKKCGASTGATTGIVPMDAAYGLGQAYRGAITGRPSVIVVLVVWLLFGPGFLCNALILIVVLCGKIGGGAGVLYLWGSVILGSISFAMLYQTTKNYVMKRKIKMEDEEIQAPTDIR